MFVLARTRRACASRARRGVHFPQGAPVSHLGDLSRVMGRRKVIWLGYQPPPITSARLRIYMPVTQDNRVGITVGIVFGVVKRNGAL